MNTPFLYTRPLQPNEMLGRTSGTNWLASNLQKGQHTVIWDHPKTGKSSLINKALSHIEKMDKAPVVCRLSCFNIRSENSFYAACANALFHQVANTLGEWEDLIQRLLPACSPQVFIPRFQEEEMALLFENPLEEEAVEELAVFPERLTNHLNKQIILVLDSFHTLDISKRMIRLWKKMKGVTFLFCGTGSVHSSGFSIYRQLFGYGMPFHKFAEYIPLEDIEEKEFTDYIIRNFAKAGRVISKDFAEMITRKMEGHPYYVQCFADICFSNTKGYMNESMFLNGLEELLEIFRQPFEYICQGLSTPQIHFLRALADNEEQLCSQEVLNKYNLGSSAHVSRVRSALEKKNIIEIVRKKPRFIDPLFSLWFRERFNKTYWIP